MGNEPMEQLEPLTIASEFEPDGTRHFYLVGAWPRATFISQSFLDEVAGDRNGGDPVWLRDGLIFFRLTNCEAVYEDSGQCCRNGCCRLFRLQRLEI